LLTLSDSLRTLVFLFFLATAEREAIMSRVTKGSLEAEISSVAVRLQRKHLGRGASDIRAFLIGDLVLVRCTDIFTPAEALLTATDEGKRLIRQTRDEMRGIVRGELESAVSAIVGCAVLRSYWDMNVEAAELVEVYVLEQDIEKSLLRQDLDRLSGVLPRKNS
jgi:uncharacterized protein YbcI